MIILNLLIITVITITWLVCNNMTKIKRERDSCDENGDSNTTAAVIV